jgi:hypothetical protein
MDQVKSEDTRAIHEWMSDISVCSDKHLILFATYFSQFFQGHVVKNIMPQESTNLLSFLIECSYLSFIYSHASASDRVKASAPLAQRTFNRLELGL